MFDAFRKKYDHTTPDLQDRVPPGQYLTEKFPVLHYGNVPSYRDLESTWDLRVWGEIEAPARFGFNEFRALPTTRVTTDIHCVTRWSKLDTQWDGVPFKEFLRRLPALKPTARFVLAHCEQGFTANIPLTVLEDAGSLIAYEAGGEPLTPDHGWPVRLVIPSKYFWKSAKWLRGIELLDHDVPGFWEKYGYNNNADYWAEERYGF